MTDQVEKQERRVFAEVELRAAADGESGPGTLFGYAAKFNKDSLDLGWFIERIRPGAFKNALKTSDVRALVNHDPNQLLGRTPDTLRLDENKIGLSFEIDLPDTQAGNDIAESVKRGDINGCSFAFTTEKDEWEYTDEGPDRREIVEVKELFDIGPVTYPAYPDTSVAARAMAQGRAVVAGGTQVIEPKKEPETELEPETEDQKRKREHKELKAQRKTERQRARLKRMKDYIARSVDRTGSDDDTSDDKE